MERMILRTIKYLSVFIVFCMIVINSGSAFAASLSEAGGSSEVQEADDNEIDDPVEIIDTQSDEDVIFELGEISQNARSTSKMFDWSVKSKCLKYSLGFYGKSGGTISVVATVQPSSKMVYVGIIEPDGVMRCVYSNGTFRHDFALDQTGVYQLYVRNMNSTTVQVTGTYMAY